MAGIPQPIVTHCPVESHLSAAFCWVETEDPTMCHKLSATKSSGDSPLPQVIAGSCAFRARGTAFSPYLYRGELSG